MGLIAGCDEAGRGAFAGPLSVGIVVLREESRVPPLIRDSKKLSPWQRLQALNWIKKNAVEWRVVFVYPEVINRLNVFGATMWAISRGLSCLRSIPDVVYVDGPHLKVLTEELNNARFRVKAVVKGDDLIPAVSCASIIAKVYRDIAMINLHWQYPWFNWEKNKGYGTAEHIRTILSGKTSPWHRKRFIKGLQNKQPLFRLTS